MTTPELTQRLRENAWIGDAVLELYVRSHILRTHGIADPRVFAKALGEFGGGHRPSLRRVQVAAIPSP